MTRTPIYCRRLFGRGPAILWDEDRGGGCPWGTPSSFLESRAAEKFGLEVASLAGAKFLADLNGWTLTRRERHSDGVEVDGVTTLHGVVIDTFSTPRGLAFVYHLQGSLNEAIRHPTFTVDELPEPYVAAPAWEPYRGYVIRQIEDAS